MGVATFLRHPTFRFHTIAFFLTTLFCLLPGVAWAQVLSIGISIHTAPPPLPVYVQPPCPAEGYLWTPGYWAYAPAGYYWVPGVWVRPPSVGVLWTPGYWGFAGGAYGWHAGYWGPHVGFYGGVNYGFGYGGIGFVGGAWRGSTFRYNTAVVNVNTTLVRNVYVDRTVINNSRVVNNHVSFNGPGGVPVQPTPQQMAFAHEQHMQATSEQMSHQQTASQNRAQFASVNGGRPATTAMNHVNARENNQQARIAQGIHSGQMTPGEAARTEHREANINHSVAQDRAANGGRMTPQERQNINRRQNSVSREIDRQKHNGPEERR